jgi:tellurite resistance protein TehA-like permease
MQLSPRTITGIVSLCVAITGLFVANIYLTMMIGELNRKRQDGSHVSYVGFTFPKILRIFGEYRRSYPDGRMHIYALTAFALAIIGLVNVAVCIRIIG